MNREYPIVGNYAPDFELPGIDDRVHHLRAYLEKFKAVSVVFIDNTIHYIDFYLKFLQEIQIEFKTKGLAVVGINPENKLEEMKKFTSKYKLNFPYLRDSNQDVARSFEVMIKPEVFLIDSETIIRYRGQIDNHPDIDKSEIGNYLRDKIRALLS